MDNLVGYESSSSDETEESPPKKIRLESAGTSNSSTPQERQNEPTVKYSEPEAPTRKSFSESTPPNRSPSEDESEAEENRLIAEGGALLAVASSAGSNCPTPSRDSEGENEEIRDDLIALPPSPTSEVDPAIAAKFRNLFEYKEKRNLDMNKVLTNRKDFKNPSMYEKLKEQFDIDEYGTNFDKTRNEFLQFEEEDYYDSLSETQAKMTEKEQNKRKKV